ncbi:MAG TPA: heptaprenyl diphosphate synthase component II [Pseudogracilibacillus sp.]|nr:heptaprenyl diphosphate synthase component II [Pseudogracilibacillus sp.]
MKLANIYGFLRKDLNQIEQSINEIIQAEHPVLREASTQLLQAGGKRIRPVFVLLSARFGDYKNKDIETVAVALELIHMATLVHDDVVDNSELRRGKPTVKHIYGDRVAMYTGDYILARALETITEIDNPEIHKTLSKTLIEVVEGEIAQIKDRYVLDQEIWNYLRRIKRKTALLIATSCKLGAISAGLNKYEVNKLYEYGYYIGMSFQIIDDILDFTATEKELGKPTGSDLEQGHITLPVFYAMQDPVFKTKVERLFESKNNINQDELTEVIDYLKQTDAIEKSYDLSNRYLNKAMNALNRLPENKVKRTLEVIAQVIGKRKF